MSRLRKLSQYKKHYDNGKLIGFTNWAYVDKEPELYIPGVLLAQELGVPFIYVRSTPKAHGLGNQIEGHFEEGQSVIVVEDLISTGGSSIEAVKALREANLNVKGLVAIFTYGFDLATENFKKAKCPFDTLTNYDLLMEQATKKKFIVESNVESLMAWKKNPADWTGN